MQITTCSLQLIRVDLKLQTSMVSVQLKGWCIPRKHRQVHRLQEWIVMNNIMSSQLIILTFICVTISWTRHGLNSKAFPSNVEQSIEKFNPSETRHPLQMRQNFVLELLFCIPTLLKLMWTTNQTSHPLQFKTWVAIECQIGSTNWSLIQTSWVYT